jgi:hypothetical protein
MALLPNGTMQDGNLAQGQFVHVIWAHLGHCFSSVVEFCIPGINDLFKEIFVLICHKMLLWPKTIATFLVCFTFYFDWNMI